MSKYRNALPHLGNRTFMTDGGLETTLIFHDGIDLPAFAAFDLLKSDEGMQRLRDYFFLYVDMAREHGLGIVLEAPTWRANADWGARLGYDAASLARVNRRAIGMLLDIRDACETPDTPVVVSGCVGPRGDGYRADSRMSVGQAQAYHAMQIETFASTDADMVAAFTMNYVEEAHGIALAAREAEVPVAISFTVETDGRLPSGDTLGEAILRTDQATDAYPVYYMINCAHPTHFAHVLSGHPDEFSRLPDAFRHPGESRDPALNTEWRHRIGGIRANASMRSHAELDESTDLDDGDPEDLGRHYAALRGMLPKLSVVGGCCGTDHRHVDQICRAMRAAMDSPRATASTSAETRASLPT